MSDLQFEDDPISRHLWADEAGTVLADKAVKDIIVFSGLIRGGRAPDPTFIERTLEFGAKSDPAHWTNALHLIKTAFAANGPAPDEQEGFDRIAAAIERGLKSA